MRSYMKKIFSLLMAMIAMCTLFAQDPIIEESIAQLKNLDRENKLGAVIAIVATRGMDRSKLTKSLEEALGCIRVSHKEVGDIMVKNNKDPNASYMMGTKMIHNYSQKVMEAINKVSKNTFFVIDGTMDPIFPYLKMLPGKSREVNWIIVQMEQPEEETLQNLQQTGVIESEARAMMEADLKSYNGAKKFCKYTFDASKANWDASFEKLLQELSVQLGLKSS